MEYLSIAGIVLGVGAFIYLSFRRYNMFMGTLVATLVVAATSQLDIYKSITDTYMVGFTGFIKTYFLLFCLSAVFGRTMEDSGCARKIAVALAGITRRSKTNAKFYSLLILPLFYFFLSYSGINGFVVVFTVLTIGRELFHEVDAPWILYPYGSAGIQPAIILGGSLYITNIMAAKGFDTPLTSMMGLSVVCAIVCAIGVVIMLYFDVKKFERRKEGFFPSGEEIMKVRLESMPDDQLPHVVTAIVCLASPVASILFFGFTPIIGLLIGTVLCCLLNLKKFKSVKGTLSLGITSSAAPIVNICGAVGFGAVLKIVPGFTLIFSALDTLEPMYSALAINLIFCSVIGSSSTHLPIVLPDLVERFAAAGFSPELGHRMSTLSVWSYMTPHNSGPVNAITLSKISFAPAAWLYFKTAAVPGFFAMLVAIIAIKLGYVS